MEKEQPKEQPKPGVLVWRTPAGRAYATAPTVDPV